MENNAINKIEQANIKTSNILLLLGWLCYLASGTSVWYGLNKIYKYHNGDYEPFRINAYVGGDAYNYIINGTYSTTFCVIGLIFAVIGSASLIIHAINKK